MSVNVLETLYAARASLSDESTPFDFYLYNHCTCGHIYRAAAGDFANAPGVVSGTNPTDSPAYAEVIVAVAKALGRPHGGVGEASWYVSEATVKAANAKPEPVSRRSALTVVNEAIAVVEAEQERNRLAVLEQARAVVDAAVPEPAPALA